MMRVSDHCARRSGVATRSQTRCADAKTVSVGQTCSMSESYDEAGTTVSMRRPTNVPHAGRVVTGKNRSLNARKNDDDITRAPSWTDEAPTHKRQASRAT